MLTTPTSEPSLSPNRGRAPRVSNMLRTAIAKLIYIIVVLAIFLPAMFIVLTWDALGLLGSLGFFVIIGLFGFTILEGVKFVKASPRRRPRARSRA